MAAAVPRERGPSDRSPPPRPACKGPREAAKAAELLGVKQVVPMHSGTSEALTGTHEALRSELGRREVDGVDVIASQPGDTPR